MGRPCDLNAVTAGTDEFREYYASGMVQDVHILMSGTCEYHGKRDLADVIKDPKMGRPFGASGGPM